MPLDIVGRPGLIGTLPEKWWSQRPLAIRDVCYFKYIDYKGLPYPRNNPLVSAD